jgi:hypothetical protein
MKVETIPWKHHHSDFTNVKQYVSINNQPSSIAVFAVPSLATSQFLMSINIYKYLYIYTYILYISPFIISRSNTLTPWAFHVWIIAANLVGVFNRSPEKESNWIRIPVMWNHQAVIISTSQKNPHCIGGFIPSYPHDIPFYPMILVPCFSWNISCSIRISSSH